MHTKIDSTKIHSTKLTKEQIEELLLLVKSVANSKNWDITGKWRGKRHAFNWAQDILKKLEESQKEVQYPVADFIEPVKSPKISTPIDTPVDGLKYCHHCYNLKEDCICSL